MMYCCISHLKTNSHYIYQVFLIKRNNRTKLKSRYNLLFTNFKQVICICFGTLKHIPAKHTRNKYDQYDRHRVKKMSY